MTTIYKRIAAGEFNNPVPFSTKNRVQYNIAKQECNVKLHKALAKAHGWVFDCELEQLLWRKAWDDGHSGGYEEVAGRYESYHEVALAAKAAFGEV
jgi:hypothetical protein